MLGNFGTHLISGVGLQARGPEEGFHGSFNQKDFRWWYIEAEFKPPVGGASAEEGDELQASSL